MVNLSDIGLKSLSSYFRSLGRLGKVDYGDVYKILALLAIDDLILSSRELFTECDIRDITKALNCLYGSTCHIPIPMGGKCSSDGTSPELDLRITQDCIERITEDGDKWRRANMDHKALLKPVQGDETDCVFRIFDFTFDSTFN